MTFGFQCDEEASHAILDTAAEAGITFLDTADVYPAGAMGERHGQTEEIIGRWLTGRRDEFIVATKCFAPTGPRPWDRGNSRKNIVRALDASLRRLRTDYVDLFQVHGWDSSVTIDETVEALDDVVRSGKVRYVGCSNYLAYQLARTLGRAEVLGRTRFASVQPRYNLLYREHERELFPLCSDERIAVIPYNPLAGGFLSGKHRRGVPSEGGRFTLGDAAGLYQDRYWNDRMFDTVDALTPIAADAGVSLATLALQWVLANPVVTSPIVGASRPDQLADAIAAVNQPIDPGLREQLDSLTVDFRSGDGRR
jgi:aryl-alcohol dehydrogenase (NADP+)